MNKVIFDTTWRLTLVILACYVGVCGLIHVISPRVLSFSFSPNLSDRAIRILARPIMDLGLNYRLSLNSDWKDYKLEEYSNKKLAGDLVFASNSQEKIHSSFLNIWPIDLSNTSKTIILEPEFGVKNEGWNLIRCFEENDNLFCQKNRIIQKASIKTAVFEKNTSYIAVDSSGNYIKLKQVSIINTPERKDLPLI